MTYRQIMLSVGASLTQLFVIIALVWLTQPGAGTPIDVRAAAPSSRPASVVAASTPPPAPVQSTGSAAAVTPPPAAPVAAPLPAPAPVQVASVSQPTSLPAPGLGMASHPLTVQSWGGAFQDAQREVYFQPFQALTGVQLEEVSTNGTLADLKQALAEGQTIDVVDMEIIDILQGCDEGVLEVIDWKRVVNTNDFMPAAVERCGVGTIIWSYVIAYSPSGPLPRAPVAWSDFWDFNGMPGKRGLRDIAVWNLEIALLADGVNSRDVYKLLETPQGVDRAFAKLDQIKPHVVWWSAGAEPPQLIDRGEVTFTTAYNGRVTNAQKEGIDIEIVWNNVIYTVELWGIVKGTPNIDEAYRFISYASQPAPQARFPEYIPYGATNLKAISLIKEELKPVLPTTPANLRNAMLSNAEFWYRNGPALEERFKRWRSL